MREREREMREREMRERERCEREREEKKNKRDGSCAHSHISRATQLYPSVCFVNSSCIAPAGPRQCEASVCMYDGCSHSVAHSCLKQVARLAMARTCRRATQPSNTTYRSWGGHAVACLLLAERFASAACDTIARVSIHCSSPPGYSIRNGLCSRLTNG